MKTATRFSAKLNRPVSTTERGMTRRGNCVFRTTLSWLTTDVTEATLASWKKVNMTTLKRRSTG